MESDSENTSQWRVNVGSDTWLNDSSNNMKTTFTILDNFLED